MNRMKPEEWIVHELKKQKKTVTAVESCTGGMVAAALTSVAGSSSVFHQSYVTYCDEAKHRLVGVKRRTLRAYTAVSKETAAQMARGGARKAGADYCVSVTGYAGPPSGDEEVGLVYIGCFAQGRTIVKECHFEGDRNAVRCQAKDQALRLLQKYIES